MEQKRTSTREELERAIGQKPREVIEQRISVWQAASMYKKSSCESEFDGRISLPTNNCSNQNDGVELIKLIRCERAVAGRGNIKEGGGGKEGRSKEW